MHWDRALLRWTNLCKSWTGIQNNNNNNDNNDDDENDNKNVCLSIAYGVPGTVLNT